MLGIILKDIYQMKKVILISIAYGVFFIGTIATSNISMVNRYILTFSFIVVATNEYQEEKNKGYWLLKTLPIKAYKIVVGKFLKTFLITILGVVLTFTLLMLHPQISNIDSIIIKSFINTFSITLIFIGIFYALQYRIGANKSISYLRIIFFVLFFAPDIINLIKTKSNNALGFKSTIEILNTYSIFGIGLIVYIILMFVSIRQFKKNCVV